jgi:NADPH-dependent curcumin reductase CurA
MIDTPVVRLKGVPTSALRLEDFERSQAHLALPQAGELLIRALYISVDPYLSVRMLEGAFAEGRVASRVIARVEESRAAGIAEGDLVLGFARWQERDVVRAAEFRLIRPAAPLPAYLGVIGHSGYTARLGIDLLEPGPGHTFTVSSAAGMVGAVAGQLAKLAGARVIGIAGGAKAQLVVDQLGFDAGVDYRDPDLAGALARAAPDGIDRHFENVGTPTLDPILPLTNHHARIALCGLMAHYASADPICFDNFYWVLKRALRIEAFHITDHMPAYEEGLAQLEKLVVTGQLRSFETISDGLETLPAAFLAMRDGAGVGKHMVRLPES